MIVVSAKAHRLAVVELQHTPAVFQVVILFPSWLPYTVIIIICLTCASYILSQHHCLQVTSCDEARF